MNGNSMFNNFTNMSTTYTPNPFQPNYPISSSNIQASPTSPNKPYEILSRDKSRVEGYFWYYGNSVDLIFDFGDSEFENGNLNYGYVSENEGNSIAILVEELLPNLTLEAILYNFRHEPILRFSNDSLISKNEIKVEGVAAIISITNELSSQLPKGKYCLNLVASHQDGYNETLFSSEMNNLYFEIR